MTKKVNAFWTYLKSTPTIVVAIITIGGGGVGWSVSQFYTLMNENANAKAELKVREKYDHVLTDYAILMATCDTNH